MQKLSLIFSMLVLSMAVMGCGPRIATRAVVGAAVIGTAAVAASHSAHFHHSNCGCPRHQEGRFTVYHYEGGYEYFDPSAGVWYRYE